MNKFPRISVVVPVRNEEKFIKKCLDSIIASDYPKDRLELFVVDGMSDDRTRDIVRNYEEKYYFITLLDNRNKITPAALNIGIEHSKSDIVIRMDAHARYEKDYISKCVHYLEKYDVDNVGGICVTLPGARTVIAESIAIALSHPFGIGNAYFRIGSKKAKHVDTVPFGCFKRDVFEKIGLFDEDLVRNQDDELNFRIIKNGGKILLVPSIVSYYYARDSLLTLWRMYYQYGYFKPLVARKVGSVLTWRQLIPSLFIASLIISGGLSFIVQNSIWLFCSIIISYLFSNGALSFSIALNKGSKYIFTLPVVFSTIHFSYGTGYLKGIMRFMIFKKQKYENFVNISLSR